MAKFIDTESRMVVTSDWGGGRKGEWGVTV